MSQPSPDRSPESRISPWPLIGAAAFLAVSLVAAGLFLTGTDITSVLPALPGASGTPAQTGLPASGPLAASPPAAASPSAATLTPGPARGQMTVALIPPPGDTSGFAQRLADGLRQALTATPLAGQVEVTTTQSAEAKSDLIVTWQPGDSGLLSLTIRGAFEPQLASVDGSLLPYSVVAPQAAPFLVDPTADPALPTRLIAALLELTHGPDADTLGRIQALQALSSGLPPEKQAANQAVILFAIAQAQAAGGNPTVALETYSQALRLQPDFPAATLNRGSVYLMLGDSAAALAAFDSVKGADPYRLAVQYNQVIGSVSAGDLDAALQAADALTRATPPPAWAFNLRGVIHYRRNEYDAALADFQQAAALALDTPALLLNQARTLTALKQADKALSIYDQLVALDPKNPSYRYMQALAYEVSGQTDAALGALSQAILLDDKYVDAYLERARLEIAGENYDQALADANRVLAFDPNNGPATQVTGDCLLAQENWIGAEKAYTAAAADGQNNAGLFAGRGYARHRQRELDGAISDYQQAISLGDKDTTLLLRLGFALLDTNRRKDALDALLGAVNGGLDTAEAHAALALALDMNYRTDEANREYQRALALDARYGDRKFLASQPLWTILTIGRAMAIVKRLK